MLLNGVIKNKFGDTYHYKFGYLHRKDGPAVEYRDGHKQWWINGNLHREDGPAVEYVDGKVRYYLHGVEQNRAKAALKETE